MLLVDFRTAAKACEAMNADLATIDTYQEDEFLVKTLQQRTKDKLPVATGYYIGFYKNGANWEWLSEEKPEYVPNRWYGSYPYSNTAAYGECMIMYKSYVPWKWIQQKCGTKYGFICES